jgi:hypothetical protein
MPGDEGNADEAKIIVNLQSASGEAADYWDQKQADLWIGVADQERFLRNGALVSLISRLTHSLKKMARSAEMWIPRNPKGYGERGDDEFKKHWKEYSERFGLIFKAKYIGWVEPFRRARNRIVHNGGEANVDRPIAEVDFSAGEEGFVDVSFSKRYRAFVTSRRPRTATLGGIS